MTRFGPTTLMTEICILSAIIDVLNLPESLSMKRNKNPRIGGLKFIVLLKQSVDDFQFHQTPSRTLRRQDLFRLPNHFSIATILFTLESSRKRFESINVRFGESFSGIFGFSTHIHARSLSAVEAITRRRRRVSNVNAIRPPPPLLSQ